ncbi:MAG: hypothetical protein K8W52_35515 [Deltaproteobacteria bacterium]|nr:hypothetical protein [Deltaproteobacteria bacterium]
MRRVTLTALAIAALPAAHAIAQPRDIAVKVVEVAGGRAYLTPGAAAGLVAGTAVQVGGKRYVVIDATDKNAAIDLGGDRIAIGASGSATVEPGAAAAITAKLPPPRPLDAWHQQWPDAVHPADTQQVKPVALGSGKAPRRARIAIVGSALGFAPRQAKAVAAASIGARVSVEPIADRPFAIDADAAAQVFYTHGGDDRARPIAVVREARIRWGEAADPRFTAGRLRWAATSVGLLDGARVAAHVGGGVELAAFGGVVPDTLSGAPSFDASRFGVEVLVDRPRAAWAPRLSVTAHGSTWQGAVDERRVDAMVDAERGAIAVSGTAEVSSFASGNPWGAPAVELTSAGLGGSYHAGGARLGLDLAYRRPERSLRLDAFLPPGWLCTRAPQDPAATSEPCDGEAARSQATASASWTRGWGSLDAGATAIAATGASLEASGFADARVRLGGRMRAEVGGAGGRAAFVDWVGGHVGLGLAFRHLDLAVRYRPWVVGYVGATAPWLEHRASVDATWTPRAEVSYGFALEGQAGNDLDALTAIATVIWRPR